MHTVLYTWDADSGVTGADLVPIPCMLKATFLQAFTLLCNVICNASHIKKSLPSDVYSQCYLKKCIAAQTHDFAHQS